MCSLHMWTSTSQLLGKTIQQSSHDFPARMYAEGNPRNWRDERWRLSARRVCCLPSIHCHLYTTHSHTRLWKIRILTNIQVHFLRPASNLFVSKFLHKTAFRKTFTNSSTFPTGSSVCITSLLVLSLPCLPSTHYNCLSVHTQCVWL